MTTNLEMLRIAWRHRKQFQNQKVLVPHFKALVKLVRENPNKEYVGLPREKPNQIEGDDSA